MMSLALRFWPPNHISCNLSIAPSVRAETGFTYDLNGNILTLNRNDGRTTGWMDNLAYDYTNSGNQLLKVTDNGDDYKGFVDGANGGNDYTYDANGNMITDQNKGIATSMTYNHLNLPEVITKGGNTVRYVYDASGRKLWQGVLFTAGFKQTDYAGEFIYEGDALQFLNHEEGRIVIATNSLVYTNPGESVTDFTAVNATLATVTQNGTEKYVRVTSSGTTARTGAFPIGGTFTVAAGNKYRIRVKGYRTGSSAAYIQVKASGADIIWPGPSIASSVGSEAWTEQTITIPTGATTLQVGVNWNTVTNGEILYINEVEITKLSTGATPEYQYHLKDHLGNVRTTFTSVTTVDQNTATLESASLNTEQSQFLRITTAKRVSAAIFDHTNGASTGFSERLNGSANEKYGVAKSISVMPGDVIQAEVYGKYVDQNSANWTGALTTLMNQIAANTAGVVYDGASYGSSTSSFPFAGLLSTAGSTGGPKAYLNWLIFDRNYTLITGGYQRMSTAPKEQGQDVAHELMSSPSISITQAGYVYIYLSNEETSPVEVYFDDFKVTHTKSPVVQVDEYYPFGLTFNSYSRENGISQDYKFNGKENQDELGLGWLDYGARMYISELGRWGVIDPLSEKMRRWSLYNYAFDNPIRFIDADGKKPSPSEAARIAKHAYGDDVKLKGGWKVSERQFKGVTLRDGEKTGLQSQVYQRTIQKGRDKGKVEYAYATAGTNPKETGDIVADATQAVAVSAQYDLSVDNATEISKQLRETNSELTFVGHSLGGGEAAANALATGRDAITFNAAGLSNASILKYGGLKNLFVSKIDAYVMKTDPLNYLQDRSSMMPNVSGTRHNVNPASLGAIFSGHSIDHMITALENEPNDK